MPVHKCPNGKYRIGSGDCIYDTEEAANKAYAGYRASKHAKLSGEPGEDQQFSVQFGVDIKKKDEESE